MSFIFENPHGGPLGAQIGSGIGRGLSESIPKEVERMRLSSALEDLANNANGLSPLQAYAKVAGQPGMTPAHLQSLTELIKQQNQRQSGFIDQPSGASDQRATSNTQSPTSGSQGPTETSPSITQAEDERTALDDLSIRPYNQLWNEAVKLSKDNPHIFPTPFDALNGYVIPAENNRIQKKQEDINKSQRAENLEDKIENDVDNYSKKFNIPETVLNKLKINALDKFNKNKNLSSKAVRTQMKNAIEGIGKTFTNLTELGNESILFGSKTSKSANERLASMVDNAIKNDYQTDLADSIQADLHVSPGTAHLLAFPLDRNPKIKNKLQNLDRIIHFEGKINAPPSEVGFVPGKGQVNRSEETIKAVDELGPLIDWKKDSPLGIARAIGFLGYDSNLFLQELKNRYGDQFDSRINNEYQKSIEPQGRLFNLNDMFMLWDKNLLGKPKEIKKRGTNELVDDLFDIFGINGLKKALK